MRRITAFRDVCLLGLGQTTEADATVRLLLYFPQHPEIAQPAGTAAQPFLSGAVSQTVNLPENATDEDIMRSYSEAWQLGLKAVAIYHDGSKRSAPLNTRKTTYMGVICSHCGSDKVIRAGACGVCTQCGISLGCS